MLRSNAKFQLQGREAAKLDVVACQQKAEAAGLKPGTPNRSGNVAAGAGWATVNNTIKLTAHRRFTPKVNLTLKDVISDALEKGAISVH